MEGEIHKQSRVLRKAGCGRPPVVHVPRRTSISLYRSCLAVPVRSMADTTCARWPSYGVITPICTGGRQSTLCSGDSFDVREHGLSAHQAV